MKPTLDLECPVCCFNSDKHRGFECLCHQVKWDLYECPECSFQFWYPPTQAAREFFERNYKDFADLSSKPALPTAQKLTLTHMPIRTGTILDIGCGDSLFLPEVRKHGFDVWGVDFNRRVIKKNKKLFRLNNLFAISIYDFALLPNLPKFDLITFFEVLEHIENPKKLILIIKNLLNKDGFIALSLPDSGMFSPWDKMLNMIPYHTAYWTPNTLRIFLAKNGFEIITMKKINRLESIALLMNTLIKFRLIKDTSLGSLKYNIDSYRTHLFFDRLSKAIKLLCRCISLPLRQFLYIVGLRPTIYVVAQHKG